MRISQDRKPLPPCPADGPGIETPVAAIAAQPRHPAGGWGWSLALHYRLRRMRRGRFTGGCPHQGRSAKCADRSNAGEMRLGDQAFRLYQGNRRPRTDGPEPSRAAVRFLSAMTSPTKQCLESFRIWAAFHFPSAATRPAWLTISTNPAMCGSGWRICLTTKLRRDDDRKRGYLSVG